MPEPIANWNETRDCWESAQTDLFSGLSDVFSETWPHSGTTRAGTAYARPTSAPLTDGSGSSSLPTEAVAKLAHIDRVESMTTDPVLLDRCSQARARLRWTHLFGINPGFTGDATTEEYLEATRGEA